MYIEWLCDPQVAIGQEAGDEGEESNSPRLRKYINDAEGN